MTERILPTTLGFASAVKVGDQSWTSDAALANVAAMSFAVAASEAWAFRAVLWIVSGTSGDIQVAFTVPSGAALVWQGLGVQNTEASTASAAVRFSGTAGGNDAQTVSGTGYLWGWSAGTGKPQLLTCDGVVNNSTTAGTLQLQAAQATSNPTTTKVLANSYLVGTRIA